MKKSDLESWIKAHEGLRLTLYVDETGNPTIGWGHNLNDDTDSNELKSWIESNNNQITIEQAQILFNEDLEVAESALSDQDFYINQPEGVQCALIDMCFNMGIESLLKFTNMIEALKAKNYTQAALEAMNSKWATQVGSRAQDVALVIRLGQ